MTKIKKLYFKILSLGLILSLFSCGHHHHDQIDDNYPFLGMYHAEENFYDSHTNTHESYQYDIEILARSGSAVEISIKAFGNNGIYGTNCAIIGSVYGGSHINIPLNVCHYNNNTTFEISGHGDLSADGAYLTFDLDIVRCDNGNCHTEPKVSISAHRI